MQRIIWIPVLVVGISGCGLLPDWLEPSPFSLEVIPPAVSDSIPGQRIVLLVSVENEEATEGWTWPVRISASAPGAAVIVENERIAPGEVAEVTVIPERQKEATAQIIDGDEERTVMVTIRATRLGIERTETVPITVTSEEEDLVGLEAAQVRDLFIPWLAENRPELGINADTLWTGTIVTPHILVVTHYLFFSDEWEMHVFWHIMIPPYDWARIELRRRFQETAPSLAFEIPSRSAPAPLKAQPIEPSESLWR